MPDDPADEPARRETWDRDSRPNTERPDRNRVGEQASAMEHGDDEPETRDDERGAAELEPGTASEGRRPAQTTTQPSIDRR